MSHQNSSVAEHDASHDRIPRSNVRVRAVDTLAAGDAGALHQLRIVSSASSWPAILPDRAGHGRRGGHSPAVWAAGLMEAHSWSRVRAGFDLLALAFSTVVALITATNIHPGGLDILGACCFPPLVMAVMHRRRAADETLSGSIIDFAGNALTAIAISGVVALGLSSLVGVHHSVELSLRLGGFAAAFVVAARVALHLVRSAAIRNQQIATPTLVVGAGAISGHLIRRLIERPGYGLRPVGLLDSDFAHSPQTVPAAGIPTLGGLDDLEQAILNTGARRVILAFSCEPDEAVAEAITRCQRLGVTVSIVPRLYQHFTDSSLLDHVGGVPVVSLRPTNPDGWGFAVKHAIDRAVASLTLLLLAPTLIALALAVRVSSPGPVLFRQRRVGRDGREFDLFKFRTMRVAQDVDAYTPIAGAAPGGVEGVDRRTAVGRFLRAASLDELPQLFNVLRGDMSIVGPRPERPEFVAHYSAEIETYSDRHRVRSGITGLAQANGLRGKTSILDRVELDNFYIRNWSLWLDFRICLMTVREVFRMRAE